MQKNLLRVFIIIALVVGITLGLAVIVGKNVHKMEGVIPVAAGETYPNLALKNLSGQEIDLLKAYPGKTLLVNFWATWCPPCISEIPSLEKIRAGRGSATFDVVYISLDFPQDAAGLKTIMQRYGLGDLDTLYMSQVEDWSKLGGSGLPITLLVSPEGAVISRMVGAMDWGGPAGVDFLKNVP